MRRRFNLCVDDEADLVSLSVNGNIRFVGGYEKIYEAAARMIALLMRLTDSYPAGSDEEEQEQEKREEA